MQDMAVGASAERFEKTQIVNKKKSMWQLLNCTRALKYLL